MDEYKSNSHKSRQNQNDDIPEKKVEKVVSGSVKSKKKNGLQKISTALIQLGNNGIDGFINAFTDARGRVTWDMLIAM